MINTVLNFYANEKWHELDSNFPEIPLIGHCINIRISDYIKCSEWIVTAIIYHLSPDGRLSYVEVECNPKE
jgi:hypothetical protein